MILTQNLKISKTGPYAGQISKCQQVEVECDECKTIFTCALFSANSQIEKRGNILCRPCLNSLIITNYNKSCKGKTLLERGYKQESIDKWTKVGGKAFAKKYKGKTLEEIHGKEKALEVRKNISKGISGEKNPMYGKKSPVGSGNGWSGWYKGWYFRSLKELSYMINVIEKQNLSWESAEKKKFRVNYIHPYTNTKRTYCCDFIIDNNTLVEIKPKKLVNSLENKAKFAAMKKWCKNNNFNFKIVTENDFEVLKLDEMKKLKEANMIKFIKRYEEKFSKL